MGERGVDGGNGREKEREVRRVEEVFEGNRGECSL